MSPVVDGGGTRTEPLGQTDTDGTITVFRRIQLTEAVGHRLVATLRIINADHRAQGARPQMPVGIDKPRHTNHAARVDHLCAVDVERRRHGDDLAATHMHIACNQITNAWINRQYVSTANHEFAAHRQRTAGGRRALCTR